MSPVRKNIFTWVIAAANAAVMFFMYLDGYASDSMVPLRFGAMAPELITAGQYWRLFTSMFVHFGFTHLLMNTGGLLIVGLRVEKYLGYVPFLLIYFVSGLTAALFSFIFTHGYAAGASGAIFGLYGAAFAYMHITKRQMEVLNGQVMLMNIIVGVGMGFTVTGVDNAAHVGGLLAGLLMGRIAAKLSRGRPDFTPVNTG